MRDRLAFRIATHHLARRGPLTLVEAAGVCGLQDTYPGGPETALAARLERFAPEDLERALADRTLVKLYSVRAAQLIVPARDLEVFTRGLLPQGEARLRAFVPGAARRLGERFQEAYEATGREALAALTAGPLSYQELHEALKERLPLQLRPFCRPCGSHHAVFTLVRARALEGGLVFASGLLGRTEQWLGRPASEAPGAPAELVRRFLHAYGPSTPAGFAAWTGVGKEQAREAWAQVEGELAPVGEAFLLESDLPLWERPPRAEGLRLLAPADPLLTMPDREALAPDPAVAKRLWRPVGSPGAVLLEGRLAGLWRPRKDRKRLRIDVEPLRRLPQGRLQAEAERVAAARGCGEVEVTGV